MQRFLILLYGFVAYLAFFATILYAIGFIGDAVVPKGINSGIIRPELLAMSVDLALIFLFGFVHSLMARSRFKQSITRIVPVAAERSTYVLVASIQFACLFFFWQPVTLSIWQFDGPAGLALRAVSLAGWVLVFWSSFLIDHFDLFGLRQVFLNFRSEQYTPRPFAVKGLYKYVRHPLMLGFLIAFWCTPHMTVGHLIFAVGMTLYILIGVKLEERSLTSHLGEDYVRYQQSTSMLLPWPTKKSR